MPKKRVYPSTYTGKLLVQDPNDLRYSPVSQDKCRTVNDFIDWNTLSSEVQVKQYHPEQVREYLEGKTQLV